MKYLHAMVRVRNLEESLQFYKEALSLKEIKRKDYPQGKFTLIYLATKAGEPEIELTYNWEQEEDYSQGNSFGHLAFSVKDIYQFCQDLQKKGITINRPPRDGKMAFIKSPDGISIELLQEGEALEVKAPWSSMPNIGTW